MLNTVTIMGRLTADPDLGQTPNNISVCKFTVAVEEGQERKESSTIYFSDSMETNSRICIT